MKRTSEKLALDAKTKLGFTLMEVLIALLVLSIGLVGIAALHLAGLRNAHSSYYTSIASSVALDFEERLWLAMTDVAEGCITSDAVDDILDDLETEWGEGTAGTITIPGLAANLVNFGTARLDASSTFDYWAEVRINLSWTDQRFGQAAEIFPYTGRVVCAPVPPAPPPPPPPPVP